MLRKLSEYRTFIMGIAILWIVLYHTWGIFVVPMPIRLFQETGYLGVDIFFFVSSYGLYHSLKRNYNLPSFYHKRLRRIIPSFVIIMILSYLILGGAFIKFIYEITFIGFFFPWLRHQVIYWYIPATMFFYFVFPFLYKRRKEITKYYIPIVLFIILIYHLSCLYLQKDGLPSYITFMIIRCPVFLLGLIYAEYENQINSFLNKYINFVLLLSSIFFIAILFCTSFFDIQSWKTPVSYIYVAMILSIPFILATCDFISQNIKILCKLILYCGRYSLEIYLLHILAIHVGFLACLKELINPNILMVLSICLSIPLAYVLNKTILVFLKLIPKYNKV